jgi:hypothetical protein
VIEMPLTEAERAALQAAANQVRAGLTSLSSGQPAPARA